MTGMPDLTRKRFELYAQLPGFQFKVKRAQGRVTDWLAHVQRPYIAFSSGKDSTCVLALVREQRPDAMAVYLDADCSFPESGELLDQTPNCLRFPCDEPFLDTLERFGLDANPKQLDRATMQSTVWGPIRRLLEEYQFDGVAYGLRADECRGRAMHAYKRGGVFQYKRDDTWGCQPIWDWTYNDVWAFIVTQNLPYCGTYDRMWDMPEEDQRVSYWAGETKRTYGRYAWLKRNYPELFRKLAIRIPEVNSYV